MSRAGTIQARCQARCRACCSRSRTAGPTARGAGTATTGPWHVALGHRRLAIIDLEGGVQPMGNEDGQVVLTYNGEVYNFQALRPALEQQGHRFRTRSDTETIVHHYEQHGEAGVAALEGMFAFAIWDAGAAAAGAGARSLRHQAALLRRAADGRAGVRLRADGGAGARRRRPRARRRGAGVVFLLRLRPPALHDRARCEEAAARAHAGLGARPAAGAARVLAGPDGWRIAGRGRRRAGRAALAGDSSARSRRSSSPTCRWGSSFRAVSIPRRWRRRPRGGLASG